MMEPVFQAGETYPFSPEITEGETHRFWVENPLATFVAVAADNSVVGTYYLRPNQPGLGGHVCNCGYIVAASARRRGIASAMCEHSQREALAREFRAIQFNFVVSTNEAAVRLWKHHGFEVVGILPEAFRHLRLGFVDAFVLYKKLQT